jgi:hypothetical protein
MGYCLKLIGVRIENRLFSGSIAHLVFEIGLCELRLLGLTLLIFSKRVVFALG